VEPTSVIQKLQQRLNWRAEAKTKEWWEKYLKGVIPFRGVKMAGNLWQRRAAGVAFVNLAKDGDDNFPGFSDMLLEVCESTVRHPERFAQTGTGWVLRELGRAEPARVLAFIEANLAHFSSEGLRYATEKMPAETKARLSVSRFTILLRKPRHLEETGFFSSSYSKEEPRFT
jgi:3-methyladenine DNA glycosylase AlkD